MHSFIMHTGAGTHSYFWRTIMSITSEQKKILSFIRNQPDIYNRSTLHRALKEEGIFKYCQATFYNHLEKVIRNGLISLDEDYRTLSLTTKGKVDLKYIEMCENHSSEHLLQLLLSLEKK